jgi:predicted transcriptional regulator
VPHARGIAVSTAVADILRVHADETFVTQLELARRTGISQSAISKMFRHESGMTVAHLSTIARALDLSSAAVLDEAERSTP